MNDQERQVIADIFRRLEQVANQPRDPEAEAFIAECVRRQPYAPYAMAQAIFVQEQALARLQAENESLRGEVEAARRREPQQGGFLSGLFGGAARAPEPSDREPPRQASPWGQPQGTPPSYGQQAPFGAPQGGMMGAGAPGPWGGAARGGGFLQSALTTAAGVAGGMMIANALSHAFGGAGDAAHAALGDKSALAGLDNAQGSDAGNAGITDALYSGQPGEEPGSDDWDMGDGEDQGDWI
ncbi:DUF2076 domain-containing protein [Microvirga thermotolerans]|uniref:DUF2076 family protein n=1 Tax=Microvirga thermotolerans TaxID=2651334 RepID=A0A5P9JV87_9HYPH|nr:DUF2076 domain-containing protein [Microvirga thermotolerans]QFU15688.1 DUF2076 family protein [Microvirga thermotolerans]